MTACKLCGSRRLAPCEHTLPDALRCENCGAISWPGQKAGAFDDDTDRLLATEHFDEQWDAYDRYEENAA